MVIDILLPIIKYPYYSGVENAVINLASEINKKCEVRIHVFNCTDEPRFIMLRPFSEGLQATETTKEGLKIYHHSFFFFPFLKFISLELFRTIINDSADIIHIQGLESILNYAILCVLMSKKKVLVFTCHGLQEGLDKINNMTFSRVIIWAIVKFYLNKFHCVIALTENDKKRLASIGLKKDKIVVIPNGIDKGKFSLRDAVVKVDNSYKILCVASFSPRKRYEDLLKALSIIKNKVDITAYLVGSIVDEKYFYHIQKLVLDLGLKDRVKIIIGASNAQVTDCYLSCDVFVLTSSGETSPLVISEAMYAGMPIIATKIGGIPDLVNDGVNGYLVKCGKPDQVADRLVRLYKDRELRNKFGERNRELSQKYDWIKIAKQTLELYEEQYNRRIK